MSTLSPLLKMIGFRIYTNKMWFQWPQNLPDYTKNNAS